MKKARFENSRLDQGGNLAQEYPFSKWKPLPRSDQDKCFFEARNGSKEGPEETDPD